MNYISYSLWGDDKRYFDGLLLCIEKAKLHYPHFTVVVFIDKMLKKSWVNKLTQMRIAVIPKSKKYEWDGLYWRFEVFDLEDCEMAIVRDSDSPSTKRESELVYEWINSDKKLHIIRDHPAHDMPIMGGMWGAKYTFPFKISACIDRWRWRSQKGTDQFFLRKFIYLKYWKDALVHSSNNAFSREYVNWIEPTSNYIGKPYFCPENYSPSYEKKLHKRPNFLKTLKSEFYLLRNSIRSKKSLNYEPERKIKTQLPRIK